MTALLPHYPVQLTLNAALDSPAAYPEFLSQYFCPEEFANAREVISRWPGYQVSPLVALPGLASAAGIKTLHYKDESQRFGLASFKPLGGAYAVTRLMTRIIKQRTSEPVDAGKLLGGGYASLIRDITVTAATDGNHGRSVAWGAQRCGCQSVIYIHQHVSPQREQAIRDLGAQVIRIKGHYDDSVRVAYQSAQAPDWYIIQDTTDGTETETTLDVMRGYTLLADEAIQQMSEPPTHLFLQAGVGGMAAAVLARYWYELGEQRPVTILCEPRTAACCYLSLQAGRPVVAPGSLETMMAGLACGEVSSLAWDVLETGANAAVMLDDDSVPNCMKMMADSPFGDPHLVAGESAVAGVIGLIGLAQNEQARKQLCLDHNSRVLVFGTEGATDPELYLQIVGKTAAEVLQSD